MCTQTEQNALDDFDVFSSTMHAVREEEDAAALERLLHYADGLQYVDVSCIDDPKNGVAHFELSRREDFFEKCFFF